MNGDPETRPAALLPLPPHPLVSIIMPSFNQSQYLMESVGSVLTQEHSAIELIFIDGASTDGTLDFLRKHDSDPRLHWVSEPDNGPTEAFNKGLRMADGDIIGILPTSDVLRVHAVREAITEFAADPLLALVGGRAQYIDEQGHPSSIVARHRREVLNFSVEEIVGIEGYPWLQASFFRRDLALAIGGFDLSGPIADSIFLLHYMLEASRRGAHLRSLTKVWVSFRVHPNQNSKSSELTGLSFTQANHRAIRRLAEQYRDFLTTRQFRLLRRTGLYSELRYRIRTLRQIGGALPSAVGYVWYGGGPHLLGRSLAYVFRKKAWFHLFRMAASEFMSLLRLLRIRR